MAKYPEDWRPTASLEMLRLRAGFLSKTRSFFAEREVLEVETPMLCSAGVTDPHLQNPSLRLEVPGLGEKDFYLQTSPEYAMKRLLAAGAPSIYQICHAFREGERGRIHNPEFTILEWYRLGWDDLGLMEEVEDLIRLLLGIPRIQRKSYREIWIETTGVDPHLSDLESLAALVPELGLPNLAPKHRNDYFDLIMSHHIEPQLRDLEAVFITDYPASQAALARIRPTDPPVAARFELFLKGLEIANGYHELLDTGEHLRRFEADLHDRRVEGDSSPEIDRRFIAALAEGLPECAGVALGFDRLLMVASAANSIDGVLSFPIDRA